MLLLIVPPNNESKLALSAHAQALVPIKYLKGEEDLLSEEYMTTFIKITEGGEMMQFITWAWYGTLEPADVNRERKGDNFLHKQA